MTEKERKAIFARAKSFRLSVEQRGVYTFDPPDLEVVEPMVEASATGRRAWDRFRATAEKEMTRLAKQLPVYPWAKSVKGFGDKGLAIICGEAGIPIAEYRTVEGLWKRMGLAVIDGERQRKKTDKAQAAVHKYSPGRRAEIWTLADAMFRHQWKGADKENGTPGCPAGPYGEVYAARRIHTEPRIAATADLSNGDPEKWTLARCYNDARRVMIKALLRDLWVAARAATTAK